MPGNDADDAEYGRRPSRKSHDAVYDGNDDGRTRDAARPRTKKRQVKKNSGVSTFLEALDMNHELGARIGYVSSRKWLPMERFLDFRFHGNDHLTCGHFVVSLEKGNRFQEATGGLPYSMNQPPPINYGVVLRRRTLARTNGG